MSTIIVKGYIYTPIVKGYIYTPIIEGLVPADVIINPNEFESSYPVMINQFDDVPGKLKIGTAKIYPKDDGIYMECTIFDPVSFSIATYLALDNGDVLKASFTFDHKDGFYIYFDRTSKYQFDSVEEA